MLMMEPVMEKCNLFIFIGEKKSATELLVDGSAAELSANRRTVLWTMDKLKTKNQKQLWTHLSDMHYIITYSPVVITVTVLSLVTFNSESTLVGGFVSQPFRKQRKGQNYNLRALMVRMGQNNVNKLLMRPHEKNLNKSQYFQQ